MVPKKWEKYRHVEGQNHRNGTIKPIPRYSKIKEGCEGSLERQQIAQFGKMQVGIWIDKPLAYTKWEKRS